MQEFLTSLLNELPGALVGIVATAFVAWFVVTPKLRVFIAPLAEFDIPANAEKNWAATKLRVESLLVKNNNLGKAVTDIEIALSRPPQDFSIKPLVSSSSELLEHGQWLLKIDRVQPREQIKIDVAYFGDIAPTVLSIRTSEGPKFLEQAYYNPMVPVWRVIALLMLAAIGLITVGWIGWQPLSTIWDLSLAS